MIRQAGGRIVFILVYSNALPIPCSGGYAYDGKSCSRSESIPFPRLAVTLLRWGKSSGTCHRLTSRRCQLKGVIRLLHEFSRARGEVFDVSERIAYPDRKGPLESILVRKFSISQRRAVLW